MLTARTQTAHFIVNLSTFKFVCKLNKKQTSKISAKQNYIISHHFTVSHFALTITTAYPWRLNTIAT